MEKQSASNRKIKYTLLSILFSILFIFTALNISTPLTTYAGNESETEQVTLVLQEHIFLQVVQHPTNQHT